jgi:hypothetical protein
MNSTVGRSAVFRNLTKMSITGEAQSGLTERIRRSRNRSVSTPPTISAPHTESRELIVDG